jgi:hypothetical protein
VLITWFGDSTYHLFSTERGWSSQQAINWMADTITNVLLHAETPR